MTNNKNENKRGKRGKNDPTRLLCGRMWCGAQRAQ